MVHGQCVVLATPTLGDREDVTVAGKGIMCDGAHLHTASSRSTGCRRVSDAVGSDVK